MLNVFKNKNTALHIAIRSNALFCDLSGLVLIIFARPLADFLGLNDPGILIILGIGLFAWALMLFWGSMQAAVPNWLAWVAIDGDLAWVVGSVILLLLPSFSFSTAGKWMIAIIADIVLVFAIWQFFALRRAQKTSDQRSPLHSKPHKA